MRKRTLKFEGKHQLAQVAMAQKNSAQEGIRKTTRQAIVKGGLRPTKALSQERPVKEEPQVKRKKGRPAKPLKEEKTDSRIPCIIPPKTLKKEAQPAQKVASPSLSQLASSVVLVRKRGRPSIKSKLAALAQAQLEEKENAEILRGGKQVQTPKNKATPCFSKTTLLPKTT